MLLVFQFIPKQFSGVELRSLWRPLKFFHCNLVKPCLYSCVEIGLGLLVPVTGKCNATQYQDIPKQPHVSYSVTKVCEGTHKGVMVWGPQTVAKPVRP